MTPHRPPRSVVHARVCDLAPLRPWLTAWALCVALVLGASQAVAEDGVIVSHGISTFGDLKYPADFAHLDYVNPDAPKGGEISVWAFGSFDSMHPYTTKGRAGVLSTVFFESLLTGTADEVGAAYGLLAERIEYPEDRSWVIFDIHPEARFSDGSPVTAQDVVFSFDLFRDKGLPSFRVQLSRQVTSAEVLGERRVKFTFAQGIPTRDLPQLVGGLPVFSKAFYESQGRDFEESSLEPLLGSGPYVLGEMEVGQTLVYTRDPDYWGADLPINVGRNNFDRIRVEYYADYNAAFEGFKGGTYTFRNEASSKSWATGYDFPAVQNSWVLRQELPDGALATGQSFVFNLRRPQFQDPRVREAISLLFNFEWSNEKLFYGIYARVNSFWENSHLAAEGLPGEDEIALLEPLVAEGLLPETILTEPAVMAPESGARQLDRRNLRRASALLDEAGWTVGADGMRRKDGQTLRVEFLNDSQTFNRVIEPYVENLRRAGIDASHSFVDNAQATNRERNYDFDIITAQFPMNYVPGSGLRQYFGSETADTSVFNKMGLQDPAVDRLTDTVLAAESDAELTTAVRALDRVLRSLRFWVPQWFKDTHTVAYYDMYAHPETLPPYDLGPLDFWWYDADKADRLRAAGAIR
ncbi:extracellular solute-binding protein [Rhodovulum adriaticum]|uniref:Microcin C transport system substrate-binding protein n=1 Tax=Rhodovulum adriaticum TaxID=35804 RepID=A0A4R2NZ99_RHOAD|nr:extracellular solute-binding protein [Rhodovulum adriaticum]MBK1636114.1 ABC transporter substrate-binding protein [Rhodovulum adriaticum]TCP27497.1 microcin C transport system substrate-binding protein [Rhodovulum adriaticum]